MASPGKRKRKKLGTLIPASVVEEKKVEKKKKSDTSKKGWFSTKKNDK